MRRGEGRQLWTELSPEGKMKKNISEQFCCNLLARINIENEYQSFTQSSGLSVFQCCLSIIHTYSLDINMFLSTQFRGPARFKNQQDSEIFETHFSNSTAAFHFDKFGFFSFLILLFCFVLAKPFRCGIC